MISLAYEFASHDGRPFGINPRFLTFEKREEFFQELREHARTQGVEGFLYHRLFGEKRPGDWFDYSARRDIENSGDPALTDFAKHMMREVIKFVLEFPEHRHDFYVGKMDHPRMRQLFRADRQAWFDAVCYEIELPRMLIGLGANVRIVFDGSADFKAYEQGAVGLEAQTLLRFDHLMRDRIVTESAPEPDHPLASLPTLCVERRYLSLLENRPSWLDVQRESLTRLCNNHDEALPVDFVRDCRKNGHRATISAHKLNTLNITPAQLIERVHQLDAEPKD